VLRENIQRVYDENQQVYGARKVWRQLKREDIEVPRCTAERLMRAMGLSEATRGGAFKTTTDPDEAAERPRDSVKRDFSADQPNKLWVADLTFVPMRSRGRAS
jgi:putative transposase